ncbi:Trehalase [Azotobacter beijerinckii]|uniref:Trehalase n=1 Tax=Azotobacter beijerinckii TaxID=170623 RepID=A0A1I4HSJ9_9GAMM|nr:Trehalase [Azotobacter beijerinckii]
MIRVGDRCRAARILYQSKQRCCGRPAAGGRRLNTTQIDTGQQWDAPNGWAPLQWIGVSGLRRYGQDQLAQTIAQNFPAQVQVLFDKKHKLVEKYSVEGENLGGSGGEYKLQDGFGWTNGVVLKLLSLYP